MCHRLSPKRSVLKSVSLEFTSAQLHSAWRACLQASGLKLICRALPPGVSNEWLSCLASRIRARRVCSFAHTLRVSRGDSTVRPSHVQQHQCRRSRLCQVRQHAAVCRKSYLAFCESSKSWRNSSLVKFCRVVRQESDLAHCHNCNLEQKICQVSLRAADCESRMCQVSAQC